MYCIYLYAVVLYKEVSKNTYLFTYLSPQFIDILHVDVYIETQLFQGTISEWSESKCELFDRSHQYWCTLDVIGDYSMYTWSWLMVFVSH